MKRVVRKFKSFKEAEEADIQYYIQLTPEQRQKIASKLKIRFYGKNCPDVRESYCKK